MAESTLAKLTAHLGAMMATVTDDTPFGRTSGQLTGQSAATIAQAALGIVRAHDEARGAQFTREQLAGAIDKVRDAEWAEEGPPPFGYAVKAGVLADRLVEALAVNADMLRPGVAFHVAPEPDADPELTAIARILGELDALGGTSGAGIASELRALAYVASRYGYELTPKDED